MKHVVNSIHPAPHETVYSALKASLMKLGLAGEGGPGSVGGGIPGKLDGAVNVQPQPVVALAKDEERTRGGDRQ